MTSKKPQNASRGRFSRDESSFRDYGIARGYILLKKRISWHAVRDLRVGKISRQEAIYIYEYLYQR